MKRFISTAKHTQEFLMGVNRIGAVIPDDVIFKSIQNVLKEDAKLNPSHSNDFKVGMKSLVSAAQSQGKQGLPKRALSKSLGVNQSIEITVPSYDQRESLAYLALRSIANYSACHVVFSEIKRRCPDFRPASLLDWGTGTGSVFWSASDVWKNDIKEATGVDVSGLFINYLKFIEHMIEIAKQMNQCLKKEGYHDLEPAFKRQISVQVILIHVTLRILLLMIWLSLHLL